MGDASGLPGTEGSARVHGILRRLGHRISFAFPPSGISTIWPPNAIVLAAVLLETPGVWWVYLLAVLPTHLHVVTSFQEGVPLAVMLSQFTTNAVHIIVGAAAVRAVAGAPPRFDSLRGMAAFILLAAIGAGAIACAVAVALFQLHRMDHGSLARVATAANSFAVLTITPHQPLDRRGSRRPDLGGRQSRPWPHAPRRASHARIQGPTSRITCGRRPSGESRCRHRARVFVMRHQRRSSIARVTTAFTSAVVRFARANRFPLAHRS